MGKRGSGSKPAPVSPALQALVDRAKHLHAKPTKPAAETARTNGPIATPARSKVKVPEMKDEEPPAAPMDVDAPAAANSKPSPMSTASTPHKSPDLKRMKPCVSSESLPSSVPSLLSFSGSSRKPHHSDSATTLSLTGYFDNMKLGGQGLAWESCVVCSNVCLNEEDTIKQAGTRGSKIYCSTKCLMKALTAMVDEDKPAQRSHTADTLDEIVATLQESETLDSGAESMPTLDPVRAEPPAATPVVPSTALAELPASKPLPLEAHAEVPASEPLPTEAQAEVPASEPLPTEAQAEVPASQPLPMEAQAEVPASQPLETEQEADQRVQLEHDLERLMVFEEATAATQRAEQAESMQVAVNKLVMAMLKRGSIDANKSARIQAVLGRRDSLEDIESLASELEQQVASDSQLVCPDPAAGSHQAPPPAIATPTVKEEPVKEDPAPTVPKSAVKKEAPTTEPKSAVKEEAQAPAHTSSAEAKAKPPSKAGPKGDKEKTPEEIIAEFEEQETKRLAHNSYVRYGRSNNCPPEIYSKVFHPGGKSRAMAASAYSGTKIMRHFYEMYVSANENWLQSSVMVNIRHGEDIANGMALNKKKEDPTGSGTWWMKHPDVDKKDQSEWELFRVFDSKVELREDEEEVDFSLGFEMNLDGEGTKQMSECMKGPSLVAEPGKPALTNPAPAPKGAGGDSNGLPPPPPPKPTKTPKQKTASQQASELVKKGAVKITEADGLKMMLQKNGVGDAFADALIKDMAPAIGSMKDAYKDLQQAMTQGGGDDDLLPLVAAMIQAFTSYDEKYKSVKKACPSKAKPKAKSQSAPESEPPKV
ncbi:unnamed protein product [Symbiodinium sp. CCMP2592]|nr:unnamed protein product [Symbiodinium sp. CCMP2592]